MPTQSSQRHTHAKAALPTIPRSRSSPNFTSTHRHLTAGSLPWLLSPRDGDKEDPFSLTGFFPSSMALGGTEEAWQEWVWLRTDKEHQPLGANGIEEDGAASDGLADALEPLPAEDDAYDPGLGLAGVEELMRKTIKEEDKLGLLSWGATVRNPFVDKGQEEHEDPVQDRLFSPYMNDEPEDHEALYLALSARRALFTHAELNAGQVDEEFEASPILPGYVSRMFSV
ncbi:hypothetical protein HGRIS_008042 [Hohenbuehelia grisea]|uniref:Uncharacterized protein n=1 Tax=Hohenbuehelia grisea TaxID=104357 RepID=A0ABR3J734_9AGAR